MNRYKIKIANTVIEIETVHVLPYALSRCYLTDEKPDVKIISSQNDIIKAKTIYEYENGLSVSWDGNVETTVVLQKVADCIINYGAFAMHGAAVAIGNKAFLFTANSGTGKTTHILKWLRNIPDSFVVNGDKPFILANEIPLVCGSPWAGKEGLTTNTMVPLKDIILLERAEDNHIEQISFAQAFPALLQQVYHPKDEYKLRKTLKLMQRLNSTVSFWRFQCNNFKDDCFDVAYNALVGKHA